MIILDSTSKSLQFKLAGAVATSQLPFLASYVDVDVNNQTPGEQDGVSNDTTAVNLVSAPTVATQRTIKSICIQNADTAAVTLTIIFNNNSTLRNIFVVTLSAGDQLTYEDGDGWTSLDKNGNIKYAAGGSAGGSGVVYNAIAGLLPAAISGTNTTASVSISSGQAADSTNVAMLSGSGFAWVVSNGNSLNGFQGGNTLPINSTIHFFICSGASGTGSFASTSLTPTLPAGYSTYYRRIFSLNTSSSGALIGGTAIESEGGSMYFWLTTQLLDINVSNLGTPGTLYTLTVPTGIKLQPLYRANTQSGATSCVLFTSPDETDVAVSGSITAAPGYDSNGAAGLNFAWSYNILTTNTSGQIRARGEPAASTTLAWITRGFKDFRRS